MKTSIIGIAGPNGSGKTTVKNRLNKEELLAIAFGVTPASIQRKLTSNNNTIAEIENQITSVNKELENPSITDTRKLLLQTLIKNVRLLSSYFSIYLLLASCLSVEYHLSARFSGMFNYAYLKSNTIRN